MERAAPLDLLAPAVVLHELLLAGNLRLVALVAPSVYLVQAHGTPVVQSTDPGDGFFAGAPPIFANSSSFEPTYAGP